MNPTTNPAPSFAALVDFDAALAPGQVVEARWTNSFNFYRERAEVVAVNRASVRVRALAGYMATPGRTFTIPRITARTWSANNCVAPLPTTEPGK